MGSCLYFSGVPHGTCDRKHHAAGHQASRSTHTQLPGTFTPIPERSKCPKDLSRAPLHSGGFRCGATKALHNPHPGRPSFLRSRPAPPNACWTFPTGCLNFLPGHRGDLWFMKDTKIKTKPSLLFNSSPEVKSVERALHLLHLTDP